MRKRPASRRLASMAALAAGLRLTGCATTEAEDDGQPGIVAGIATIAGQIVGGFLMGMAGAFGSEPQDATVYRSQTYSTRAYAQSYASPVYQAPQRHSHHHHGHRRH